MNLVVAPHTIHTKMAVSETRVHENKAYPISNTANVSVPELVKSLSEIIGKSISYVSPPVELFIETMAKSGVPDQLVNRSYPYLTLSILSML